MKNEAFCVTGIFLDISFIECIWVHLKRNHNNSFVFIEVTGILYEMIYFGSDFIMIMLLLMNLQEIQMPVIWQIECFIPIYNAVHNDRMWTI